MHATIGAGMQTSARDDFHEYFLRPIGCSLRYAPGREPAIEAASRTREFCREAAFALAGASRFIPIDRPDFWMERFRIMRFLDRSDLFLTLSRSDRWLDRWVRVEGSWPIQQAFVAVTFHYGAGFWALRHLHRSVSGIDAVRADLQRSTFEGNWVRFRYQQLRIWNLDRELRSAAMVVGDDVVRRAVRALNEGQCFLGLFDIPGVARNAIALPFLGRTGSFNRGLLHIAKIAKVPIVAYTMRIGADGLTRVLEISDPIPSHDELAAGRAIVARLERALATDGAQWHNWGVAPSFFAQADRSARPRLDSGASSNRLPPSVRAGLASRYY